MQFSGLSTEAKTIIAAINEAAQNGGTEVEANPAGTPTDTLEKIGIDGTIYEVGSSEPVSKTATGNPIHIEDAADAPIVSGTVVFEPKQDLHGYDKPWAGGAGKNKLPLVLTDLKTANTNGTWNDNVYTINNGTITVNTDDGGNVTSIKANGTFNASTNFFLKGNWNYPTNTDFILNGCPSDGSSSTYNIHWWIAGVGSNIDSGSGVSVSTPSEFASNTVLINIASSHTMTNAMFYPMIRLATETDPTFEPYTNICPIIGYTDCEVEVKDDATSPTVTNTYTIDLDGTRYGGRVNPVSGEMLGNMIGVDLGDFTWEMRSDSDGNYFRATLSPSAKPKTLSDLGNNLCSVYPISPSSAVIDKSLAVGNTGNIVYIRDTDYPDADTFKTAMSGAQLVYELAAPFTVQLTPEQIRTLEGTNNISTNMTTMSLEYITQDYQPLVKLIEQSAGHHYSAQEKVIGTWIDGKTLYEKVVDFGTLPNTTSKSVAHDISNLDAICFVDAIANNGSGAYIPIPFVSKSGLQYQLSLNLTTTDIVINTGDNFTTYSAFITLQYTKTTD